MKFKKIHQNPRENERILVKKRFEQPHWNSSGSAPGFFFFVCESQFQVIWLKQDQRLWVAVDATVPIGSSLCSMCA